jgi:serine/threonine protein kinase
MADKGVDVVTAASPRRYPVTPDGYEFLEELGHGENSAVYRAICPAAGNEAVAIKVINLEGLPLSLDDLIKEIRVMSLSSHENVVPYRTSFSVGHNLWIVMPFVAGTPVGRILRHLYPEGFPDEAVIRYILHGTLRGLEYFHRNRQIHRNIKADNILLTPDARILLTDYTYLGLMLESGISRRLRQTFVGTPCWMAPEVMEQVSGYDYKADIWSFGITAIELAQGCAPYERFAPMKVLQLTLQGPPPTLEHPERFSREFRAFVELCLHKDPHKRPSASELLKHPFMQTELPLENGWAANMLSRMPPLELNPLSEKERISLQRGHVASAGAGAKHPGQEPWSQQPASSASSSTMESQASQTGRRSPEHPRNVMGISGWNFADSPELIEAKRERDLQRIPESIAVPAPDRLQPVTDLAAVVSENEHIQSLGSSVVEPAPVRTSRASAETESALSQETAPAAENLVKVETGSSRRAGRFLLVDTEPSRPHTSPSTACLVHEDIITREMLTEDVRARASPRPGAVSADPCASDSSSTSSVRPRFYNQSVGSRNTAPPELGMRTGTSMTTDEGSTTITSLGDGIYPGNAQGQSTRRLLHSVESGNARPSEAAVSAAAAAASSSAAVHEASTSHPNRSSTPHVPSGGSALGEASRRSSHGRFEVIDIPLHQAMPTSASARAALSSGAAATTAQPPGSSASTGDVSPHNPLYVSLAALDGVFQQPQSATRSPPRAPKPKSPPPPPSRWATQPSMNNNHPNQRGYGSVPGTATCNAWQPHTRITASSSTSPKDPSTDASAAGTVPGRAQRATTNLPLANVSEEDLLALLHHARGLQRTLSALLAGNLQFAASAADISIGAGPASSAALYPGIPHGVSSIHDSGSGTGPLHSYVSPRVEHSQASGMESGAAAASGISVGPPAGTSGYSPALLPHPVMGAVPSGNGPIKPGNEPVEHLRGELSSLRQEQGTLRRDIEALRQEMALVRQQLQHLTVLAMPATTRAERVPLVSGSGSQQPTDVFGDSGDRAYPTNSTAATTNPKAGIGMSVASEAPQRSHHIGDPPGA